MLVGTGAWVTQEVNDEKTGFTAEEKTPL